MTGKSEIAFVTTLVQFMVIVVLMQMPMFKISKKWIIWALNVPIWSNMETFICGINVPMTGMILKNLFHYQDTTIEVYVFQVIRCQDIKHFSWFFYTHMIEILNNYYYQLDLYIFFREILSWVSVLLKSYILLKISLAGISKYTS